jgi:hypothetical protein
VPDWTPRGTLLFGRMPLLGQIYHGALPLYVGLPVYVLFGTGVVGIRLANLLFGALVLAAVAAFLRAFKVRAAIAGACAVALALDPGFLFAFRTQFYITLLPVAALLASVALLEARHDAPTRRVAAACGCLAGIAVYGYFIYLFLLPAVALHAAWRWGARSDQRALALAWLAGAAIGTSPYLLALLLMTIANGGVHGMLQAINTSVTSLAITTKLSLPQRLGFFAKMAVWTIHGAGPAAAMLHRPAPQSMAALKTVLLLAIPTSGLLLSLARPPRSPGLVVIAGCLAGCAALFAVFGNRLWLHHAVPILPLLYIGLALTLDLLASWAKPRRALLATLAACAVAAPLLAANWLDQQATFGALETTGGVGLASEALDRFAADSAAAAARTSAFFPDWGVFMPFEMITHGRIPISTGFPPEAARQALCHGRDVLVALVDARKPDRLEGWIGEVGWGQPDITPYYQRDGVPVLTAIRWHASAKAHAPCPR